MKTDHKILIPALHYPPVLGGFEVFLKNIAERIGRSLPLYILTGKVEGAPREEHHNHLTIDRSASLFSLKDYSYSSHAYILTMLPILLVKTIALIWREEITLLHAAGFYSGLVCLVASKITRVPYVITIQSADFTIYHEEVQNNLVVRLQSFVERLIYKHAKRHHAVSNDLCKHFKSQAVDECIMIPNGVETDLFRPFRSDERRRIRKEYDLPEDSFIFSNVSRLETKNGIPELIEAFATLARDDTTLLIIGDGSEREALEAKAREEGVSDDVIFLGQVQYEMVGKIIGGTDAFVRTPRSEGFGIVFIEGMAARLPTIGTNTGGIPDFIEDGVTGLLCEPCDVASITRALKLVLTDDKLRERIASGGLELVQEKYDWDAIARRIERELYHLKT